MNRLWLSLPSVWKWCLCLSMIFFSDDDQFMVAFRGRVGWQFGHWMWFKMDHNTFFEWTWHIYNFIVIYLWYPSFGFFLMVVLKLHEKNGMSRQTKWTIRTGSVWTNSKPKCMCSIPSIKIIILEQRHHSPIASPNCEADLVIFSSVSFQPYQSGKNNMVR